MWVGDQGEKKMRKGVKQVVDKPGLNLRVREKFSISKKLNKGHSREINNGKGVWWKVK